MPEEITFNDRTSILALLHSRRSGKARDMAEPGPDAAQIDAILRAATRVPDHGKLAPWRFVIVRQESRTRLADIMERAWLAEKPGAGPTEISAIRAFALEAPTLMVALSTPRTDSHIPLWEQQLSMGAAIQNALLAAHALGFVGNWLTGWPAYADAVKTALGGGPADRIAGFLYFGTATKSLEERPRPILKDVTSCF